jgi:hypothetical protein
MQALAETETTLGSESTGRRTFGQAEVKLMTVRIAG